MVDAVGECKEGIAEVDIFDSDIFIVDAKVIVGKVPECLDTEFYELFGDFLSISLWYAQHSHSGLMFFTESFKVIVMHNCQPCDFKADNSFICIEDTCKFTAAGFKIDMRRYSTPEVACAYKDSIESFIDTEYLAYLFMQAFDMVAIALLAEAAEAIEILSYLGSGKLHSQGKFTGGDTFDTLFHKLTQKSIIARKAFYN